MTNYENMSLREELETRFKETEEKKRETEMLSHGWQPPAENVFLPYLKSVRWLKVSPLLTVTYPFAEALGATYPVYKNLKLRKEQMEQENRNGADNYYHRLGMHDAGSLGLGGALVGLGGGILKEAYDIKRKVVDDKKPLWPTLSDSKKDMMNNLEGLWHGLTKPEEDGRVWLKDLDIKTNVWKNKR